MTREAFIRKWLANAEKQYNEQCRNEMRDDLDLVYKTDIINAYVTGRFEDKNIKYGIEYINKLDVYIKEGRDYYRKTYEQ